MVDYGTKQNKRQKKTVPWLGYPNKWNGLSVPGTVTGRVPAKSLFAFLTANLADLDFLFVDGGFVENLDAGFAAGRTSAVTVIDGGAQTFTTMCFGHDRFLFRPASQI